MYLSSRAFPFSAVFLVRTLCIPMILLLFYAWLFHHPGLWRTMRKRQSRYGLVINDKQLLLKSRTSCWHSDSPKCLGHLCRNLRRVSVSLAFWRTRGMLSVSAQDRCRWQNCRARTHKLAFPFQHDFGGVYLVHHSCTFLQSSLYCEESLLITLNPNINTKNCKGCLQTCRCNYRPVLTQSTLSLPHTQGYFMVWMPNVSHFTL